MNYKEKLRSINCVVLDFDGVLTDGKVYLLPPKEFVRTMHVRDSYIIEYAVKKGIRFVVITGGNNDVVIERMRYLGVEHIYTAVKDKKSQLDIFLKETGINNENVMYVGDDIPDLECMKSVGLACCPNDAVLEIKQIAHYVSPIEGGKGMVRELMEQLLKVQGKWLN